MRSYIPNAACAVYAALTLFKCVTKPEFSAASFFSSSKKESAGRVSTYGTGVNLVGKGVTSTSRRNGIGCTKEGKAGGDPLGEEVSAEELLKKLNVADRARVGVENMDSDLGLAELGL